MAVSFWVTNLLIMLVIFFMALKVKVTESQSDTEFLITFPESEHTTKGSDLTERIYVTLDKANGFTQNTLVTLYMKDPDEEITVTLTNENPSALLNTSEVRQFPTGNIKSRTYLMRLVASGPVNVAVRSGGKSNLDSYLAMPVNSLGRTYFAIAFLGVHNVPASFVVIATLSKAASLTLKFPERYLTPIETTIDDVVYRNNDVMEFSLSPYEAYQLQFLHADITGARIESDEVIAVWSGANRTGLTDGSKSHILEQVPPANMAGKQFALFPFLFVSEGIPGHDDVYRVINIYPNTELTTYRGGMTTPSNPTETYFLSRAGSVLEIVSGFEVSVTYLESSKPVIVYWISPSSDVNRNSSSIFGDVSSMWLPPLDVSMPSAYTFPGIDGLEGTWVYVSFVIQSTALGGLTLDGVQATSVTEFNLNLFDVSGRPDLIAGTFARIIEYPWVLITHELRQTSGVGFVAMYDKKTINEAEGHPLSYGFGYPDFEFDYNADVESDACCVTVDENGIALYPNECSDNSAPHLASCCILGNKMASCKAEPVSYTICSHSETLVRRATSIVTVWNKKSALACHVTCVMKAGCLGVNFDIVAAAAEPQSSPSCQLLFGSPLGYVNNLTGTWRHVTCKHNVWYTLD